MVRRWLEDRAEASRRKARPGSCYLCGAETLVGPSDDTMAWTAVVDAEPVEDLHVEMGARLADRFSYEMHNGALYTRYPENLRGRPRPVYLDHRCSLETNA